MSSTSNQVPILVPRPFAELLQKEDYTNLKRYMIERQAFENMMDTLNVLTSRSIFQKKIYEFIKENTAKFITSAELDSTITEDRLLQNIRYLNGYSQIVYLCSAVETFFTYTYLCSFKFYYERNPLALFKSIDGLKNNKNGPDRSKIIINTIKNDNEFSEKAIEQIKKIIYSELDTVKKMFMQIYGDVFEHDQIESFGSFSNKFNQLKTKRNGILHRGGEYSVRKNSVHRVIVFKEEDFTKYYNLSLEIKTTLSDYLHLMFRHWWQNENLSLTRPATPDMFKILFEYNLLEKCNLIEEFAAHLTKAKICRDL